MNFRKLFDCKGNGLTSLSCFVQTVDETVVVVGAFEHETWESELTDNDGTICTVGYSIANLDLRTVAGKVGVLTAD